MMRGARWLVAVALTVLLMLGSGGAVGAARHLQRALPAGVVVSVHGRPITLANYHHWLVVVADGAAAGGSHSPPIVPFSPPRFAHCIAQVRAQLPSFRRKPAAVIRSDCEQLFVSLNASALGYLIKGAWYQLEARRLHITVTDAQVERAFQREKHQQFSTPRQFALFLARSGQTPADVLFRVRLSLLNTRLVARHTVPVTPASVAGYYRAHRSEFSAPHRAPQTLAQATPLIRVILKSQAATNAQAAVDRIAAQHWQASTICQPLYVMADCAGAPAG